VKIRDKRTHIAHGIRTLAFCSGIFEITDASLGGGIPGRPVPFIDGINFPFFGDAHVLVGQQEVPHARIQRKTMHAVPGGKNEHG
jgi:hypothetical protein